MSIRPKFDPDAYEFGKIAEEFYNYWLQENLHPKYSYIWHNRKKESYLDWDFSILENGKKIKLIEVERKDAKYRKDFKDDGIDFIENKCCKVYPLKCDYVLIISDFKNMYWLPMIEVIRRGKLQPKDTIRGIKDEEFIRVKLDMCNEVKI